MTVTGVPHTRFFLKSVASGIDTEITRDMMVGREGDGLRLTHPDCSRTHAQLTLVNGIVMVDDRSTHGTFINGERVTRGQPRPLTNGARVQFYPEDFVFRVEGLVSEATRRIEPPPKPVPAPAPAPAPAPVEPAPEEVVGGDRNLPPAFVMDDDNPATQRLTPQQRAAARQLIEERLRAAREAAGVDASHLRLIENGKAGREIVLRVKDGDVSTWTVGRNAGQDIQLDTPGVSGVHAVIKCEHGRWTVADQMSANGTWVNGKNAIAVALKNGDFICFGTVECVFRLPGKAGAPAPRPRKPGEVPGRVITPEKTGGLSPLMIGILSFVAALILLSVIILFL